MKTRLFLLATLILLAAITLLAHARAREHRHAVGRATKRELAGGLRGVSLWGFGCVVKRKRKLAH